MTRCYLALGGNVGDVERHFADALSDFGKGRGINVVCVSSTYRTQPIGTSAGDFYQNAAAGIDTALDPFAVLDVLQELEKRAGRTRTGVWQPRPLDLDLIFYGDRVINDARLQVPHPACWYRRFVLDPLAEIAPDALHPIKGLSVSGLRERLLPRPLRFALAGGRDSERHRLADALALVSESLEVVEWSDAAGPHEREPAIVAWLGPESEAVGIAVVFESLPLLPRLDASAEGDPLDFLTNVARSALG